MASGFPPSEFWDFSIALYGKQGVAPACLELQERHGADVNVLMFCLWLAASGRGPAEPGALEAAFSAVETWHGDVVRALRAVRKRMKTPIPPVDDALAQALRARLQKIEIDAEHLEQLTLAASGAAAAAPRAALPAEARAAHAAAHAAAYLARIGAAPSVTDAAALAAIMAPAFALPEAALRGHVDAALARK